MNVRVRGIYATALTALFEDDGADATGAKGDGAEGAAGSDEGDGAEGAGDDGVDADRGVAVVQASRPIRERFDADLAVAVADATVRTTDDRLGVGVTGTGDAVAACRHRLSDVGIDALAWDDAAPRGSVFAGDVVETLGSGAVVDLGAVEGFLPYRRVDGYVDEGDRYRVQVAEPAPPWSDDRPSLATALRFPGWLFELRRGEGDDDRRGETARMADLLPVDPPAGWHARWARVVDDAPLGALADALERAGERAAAIDEAVEGGTDGESSEDDGGSDAGDEPAERVDGGSGPGLLVAPVSGAWVLFGRESRFALDQLRRRVTTTMPGHHRTKAAADGASTAVDFAEAVCEPGGEFPFGAVTGQFGPREGDRVAIAHGKPSGRTIVLGRGEVTDLDPSGSVTLERELSSGGTYDALDVEREVGDVAVTTVTEGRWWYATVYRSADGGLRGTYVNVCTPVEVFPDAVRYVDLHVDVVKWPDGEVRRVDDDELDAAVEAGDVPGPLAERARTVASSIERGL